MPESRRTARGGGRRASLDDLVGTGEDQWWDRQAERLGGFEIDDQLEGGRLLNRKVGRFGALQDLVDVVGRERNPLTGLLPFLMLKDDVALLSMTLLGRGT